MTAVLILRFVWFVIDQHYSILRSIMYLHLNIFSGMSFIHRSPQLDGPETLTAPRILSSVVVIDTNSADS